MTKRQLKFYWVLLYELLEREQIDPPPDNVKDLVRQTKELDEHLQDCRCEYTTPEIKRLAIELEANDMNGQHIYCALIGEEN